MFDQMSSRPYLLLLRILGDGHMLLQLVNKNFRVMVVKVCECLRYGVQGFLVTSSSGVGQDIHIFMVADELVGKVIM